MVVRATVIAFSECHSLVFRGKKIDRDTVNLIALTNDLEISFSVEMPIMLLGKKLERLKMSRFCQLDSPYVYSSKMTASAYNSSNSRKVKDVYNNTVSSFLAIRRKLRSFASYDSNEHKTSKNAPLRPPSGSWYQRAGQAPAEMSVTALDSDLRSVGRERRRVLTRRKVEREAGIEPDEVGLEIRGLATRLLPCWIT